MEEKELKRLIQEIQSYQPINEQEARDKVQMLDFMKNHPDCLERENTIAHITVSIWTVNKERIKTLMVYHNIYNSWSWIGGHADGNADLCAVALKELQEETGVNVKGSKRSKILFGPFLMMYKQIIVFQKIGTSRHLLQMSLFVVFIFLNILRYRIFVFHDRGHPYL